MFKKVNASKSLEVIGKSLVHAMNTEYATIDLLGDIIERAKRDKMTDKVRRVFQELDVEVLRKLYIQHARLCRYGGAKNCAHCRKIAAKGAWMRRKRQAWTRFRMAVRVGVVLHNLRDEVIRRRGADGAPTNAPGGIAQAGNELSDTLPDMDVSPYQEPLDEGLEDLAPMTPRVKFEFKNMRIYYNEEGRLYASKIKGGRQS